MEESLPAYEFTYLWFTNNNSDNTVDLLQNQTLLSSTLLTVKEYSDEELNVRRIVRLAQYREEQLKQILSIDAQYLLMIDTEIFFNGSMIQRMIESLNTTNADRIAPFTVNKFGFYHDTFAHIDIDGTYMKPTENSLKTLRKRNIRNNPPVNPYEVKSAFGGLFLAKKEILFTPGLTYITKEPACEHLVFNQTLLEVGCHLFLDNHVTPIICGKQDYESTYQMVTTNQFDLRPQLNLWKELMNVGRKEIGNEILRGFKKKFKKQ